MYLTHFKIVVNIKVNTLMWTLKCKYGKPGTVTPKSCWSLPATMSFQLWYLPLCNTWTRSYCPFWDPNLYHHIPKTPSPLCSYIFRMMQNKCNIDCFWIPADAFYAISCHTLILRSFIIHICYHFWMFTKYNQLMEDRWTIYFVLTSPTTQSKINQLIIKTLVSNLPSRSNILIQKVRTLFAVTESALNHQAEYRQSIGAWEQHLSWNTIRLGQLEDAVLWPWTFCVKLRMDLQSLSYCDRR